MKKGNQRPISVSASCFLPTSLLSLRLTAKLAKGAKSKQEEVGFTGIEAVPFQGAVLETLLGGLPDNLAVPITSAHCHFNPIPIGRKVREFGKGAAVTDLILFPPNRLCEEFLAKLNRQGIPVSTYFVQHLREKGHIYNSFQLHPDLGMTLEEIVSLLEETGAKATVDLRHIRRGKDPRQGGGYSPLPNWRTIWAALKDRTDNVHIQYLGMDELQGMLDGNESTELAVMLRHIAKSGYEGLFTLEITMTDIARLFGPKALLPSAQVRRLSQLRQFVEAQLM